MNKPLLNTLHGIASDIPPLWFMRQAGRYLPEYRKVRSSVRNFLELCYTPELAAEVTLQPITRFNLDAAILFSDILVIPDALGCNVAFREGEGPVLSPITCEDDLKKLALNAVENHLSPVYDAVKLIRKQLPEKIALIGFSGSPWTVATYMIEGKSSKNFALVKTMAYSHPALFEKLISLLVEATILHLDCQIKAGAEAVQLFDSWSGVLNEEGFRKWVIEPTAKIVNKLKILHPNVPIIGFPKGAAFLYAEYVAHTGIDAVSIDHSMPLGWVNEHIPQNITLQGCLDPILLLGEKAPLQREVEKILTAFRGRPFIFNLGHGILPETPIENVECMIENVRRSSYSL